ncbi:hypothetical protein B5E64_14635, partial [Drancourtella sp. An12]
VIPHYFLANLIKLIYIFCLFLTRNINIFIYRCIIIIIFVFYRRDFSLKNKSIIVAESLVFLSVGRKTTKNPNKRLRILKQMGRNWYSSDILLFHF